MSERQAPAQPRLYLGAADIPVVGAVEVGADGEEPLQAVFEQHRERRAVVETVVAAVHPDGAHVGIVRIRRTQRIGDADEVIDALIDCCFVRQWFIFVIASQDQR